MPSELALVLAAVVAAIAFVGGWVGHRLHARRLHGQASVVEPSLAGQVHGGEQRADR